MAYGLKTALTGKVLTDSAMLADTLPPSHF